MGNPKVCAACGLVRGTPEEARARLRLLPMVVMAVLEGGSESLTPLARCWHSDDVTCAVVRSHHEEEDRNLR